MDDAFFISLASAYGGDVEKWPELHRAAARRFMAQNPGAEKKLASHRMLDALLDAYPPAVPSASLKARIMATALEANGRPPLFIVWFAQQCRGASVAFALMVLLGIWVGANPPARLARSGITDNGFVSLVLGPDMPLGGMYDGV
ncbi:MAG: hypothetical protein JO089_06885 [Alphaproteobacteria bacterium]|nr:hypothetical protein [Alphaproteobacteria bacterium]